MYKKLVRYDQWHFSEVDHVRLRRCALALKDQIILKVDRAKDLYWFYSNTMPVIEKAIRREIIESTDLDLVPIISGNYKHDKSEGILPPVYDREFAKAVAGFSVTLQGISLEQTEKTVIDGVTYGLVDFEEEGDWPDKVKYL